MTTKTETKPTYYATRDFNDAGTGRSFEAGKVLNDIDEGTALNYEAGGLASTEKPKSEDQAAIKPAA